MSTQQDIYAAGSESRPPMLNKENYVPWSSRLLRYAKSRPNGKLIHNSILNGPYVRKMILEPGDANSEITVTETFYLQTDDELFDKELKQIEADDQAIQTILLGLPEDIYAAVDKFVDDTDFASDIPTDGPTTVEMVNATKDNFDEDGLVKFQEVLLDAEKPLYEGCTDFTKLSAIVKLLNLKGKYGASDKFFTELLGLIKKMLPADSQAWRTIDEKFPKIAEDPRKLRLGISADGVEVNTGNRHHRYPGNDIDVF
nr:ribonuclease H-like domain-containing protein [Tanacetum cinerariifolium]